MLWRVSFTEGTDVCVTSDTQPQYEVCPSLQRSFCSEADQHKGGKWGAQRLLQNGRTPGVSLRPAEPAAAAAPQLWRGHAGFFFF